MTKSNGLGEFEIRRGPVAGESWQLWHKTAGYLMELNWEEVRNVIRRRYDTEALLRGDLVFKEEEKARHVD